MILGCHAKIKAGLFYKEVDITRFKIDGNINRFKKNINNSYSLKLSIFLQP